ncbi:MAG: acyltransferase [Clostridia bacterium]|nr:acyltransferase [Clostridia bacterium]
MLSSENLITNENLQVENSKIINSNDKTAAKSCKANRNCSIELLRIVAAIMVVFNHTFNMYYSNTDGTLNLPAIYVNLINVCAVGCFFMITGYFMFKGNKSYGEKLKKTFFDLLLPTIIIIILIQITEAVVTTWGLGIKGFASQLLFNFKDVIKQFLAYGFSGRLGYLWYVLSYIVVMIWYPLLKYICVKDRQADNVRRMLIVLCLLYYICRDAVVVFDFSFQINVVTLFSYNVLFVLLGYECSRFADSEFFKNNRQKIGVVALFVYFVGCGLGMLLTYTSFIQKGTFNQYFYYLSNIPVIISAFGLFVTFLCIKIDNDKIGGKIRYIGKQTLYIYLLQSPMHVILLWLEIKNSLFNTLGFFTYILIAVIVFSVSLVLAILLNRIKDIGSKRMQDKKAKLQKNA